MDRLDALEAELESLAHSHPPFPRAWREEVERRMAETGFAVEDVIFEMREEYGFVAPGPAPLEKLIECEKRFLTLFEPDELLDPAGDLPARSTAD